MADVVSNQKEKAPEPQPKQKPCRQCGAEDKTADCYYESCKKCCQLLSVSLEAQHIENVKTMKAKERPPFEPLCEHHGMDVSTRPKATKGNDEKVARGLKTQKQRETFDHTAFERCPSVRNNPAFAETVMRITSNMHNNRPSAQNGRIWGTGLDHLLVDPVATERVPRPTEKLFFEGIPISTAPVFETMPPRQAAHVHEAPTSIKVTSTNEPKAATTTTTSTATNSTLRPRPSAIAAWSTEQFALYLENFSQGHKDQKYADHVRYHNVNGAELFTMCGLSTDSVSNEQTTSNLMALLNLSTSVEAQMHRVNMLRVVIALRKQIAESTM